MSEDRYEVRIGQLAGRCPHCNGPVVIGEPKVLTTDMDLRAEVERLRKIEARLKDTIKTITCGGTAYELLPDGGRDAVVLTLRRCLGQDGYEVEP